MDNLWSFIYHRGPASLTGIVRASSEAKAIEVVDRWCRNNNFRPPASVRPMVVADESILGEPVKEQPKPVPTAVEATTAVSRK